MANRGNTRGSRRSQHISYRDPSSSDLDSGSDDEHLPEDPPAKKRRVAAPPRTQHGNKSTLPTRSTRSRPASHAISTSTVNKAHSSRPLPKDSNKKTPQTIPSDDVIPNWASLPYEILLTIFQYASTPLRDDLLVRPLPSVNWLLNTARTCRAFKEPALAALYESPPLFELGGPHQLFHLLSSDQAQWSMPYASKIKRLEVDVNRTLGYTVPGRGLIHVVQLIQLMPQLSEINFQDTSDKPPYRLLHRGKPWFYPQGMIASISASDLELSRWHWNAHMVKQLKAREGFPEHIAEQLITAHESSALNQLTELCMSKFPRAEKGKRNEERPADLGDRIRRVLAPLKKLRSLSLIDFAACEKAWPATLLALPTSLRSLTISQTQYLDGASLETYLESHGQNLQELVLNHNQNLGLHFTKELKRYCPQLQALLMDFTFYSAITSYEDNKPLFDALLLPEERPTWPSTLRTLELYNMRQWGSDAAEVFFLSLIESASDLPCLRRLIIKAILDIAWRDRAGFREKWIGGLEMVFLRQTPDPDPSLASKRAYRERDMSDNADNTDNTDAKPVVVNKGKEMSTEGTYDIAQIPDDGRERRSQRIKTHEAEEAQRSRRIKMQEAEDAQREIEEAQRRDWELSPDQYIQGLCEVVDVSIDNNRPGEVQFTEGDFLDSDPGEDEEYVEE